MVYSLRADSQARTPLLAAAAGAHACQEGGGARPPIRTALIHHWMQHRLLRAPVPLTGAVALLPGTPWAIDAWIPSFLTALAGKAEDGLHLLAGLERAWVAAAPLLSATSLAAGLGMAVNNAADLLDGFRAAGIAVEVTHRAKRRLVGLADLAPLGAPP